MSGYVGLGLDDDFLGLELDAIFNADAHLLPQPSHGLQLPTRTSRVGDSPILFAFDNFDADSSLGRAPVVTSHGAGAIDGGDGIIGSGSRSGSRPGSVTGAPRSFADYLHDARRGLAGSGGVDFVDAWSDAVPSVSLHPSSPLRRNPLAPLAVVEQRQGLGVAGNSPPSPGVLGWAYGAPNVMHNTLERRSTAAGGGLLSMPEGFSLQTTTANAAATADATFSVSASTDSPPARRRATSGSALAKDGVRRGADATTALSVAATAAASQSHVDTGGDAAGADGDSSGNDGDGRDGEPDEDYDDVAAAAAAASPSAAGGVAASGGRGGRGGALSKAKAAAAAAGGGARPVSAEARRTLRLERNRESARQSRRRKKAYVRLLECRIEELRTQIRSLRVNHVAEAERELAGLQRLMLSSLTPIAERALGTSAESSSELTPEETVALADGAAQLVDRFGPGCVERRTAGEYALDSLQRLVLPPHTRFLLWLVHQPPEFFSAGGGPTLWTMLCAELGLSPDQSDRLRAALRTAMMHPDLPREAWRINVATAHFAKLRGAVAARAATAQEHLDVLVDVLTPAQLIVFAQWAATNSGDANSPTTATGTIDAAPAPQVPQVSSNTALT